MSGSSGSLIWGYSSHGHGELPWFLAGGLDDDAQQRPGRSCLAGPHCEGRRGWFPDPRLELLQRLPVAARTALIVSHPVPSVAEGGESEGLVEEGGHDESTF